MYDKPSLLNVTKMIHLFLEGGTGTKKKERKEKDTRK